VIAHFPHITGHEHFGIRKPARNNDVQRREFMTFGSHIRPLLLVVLTFAIAGVAAAQGPIVGSNSTTSELAMSATVQTAVQLNISTGSGGATVSGNNSTGLFSISFGNVNGLGVGTPAAGVTVVTDTSGALYKTPINLTPLYSGFATETATITVLQDAAGDTALAREGDSNISSSSTVSPTTPATVATGQASGVALERFVGLYIPRTEAAGAKTATLIYTITVQ
jgi:hypothetical protein